MKKNITLFLVLVLFSAGAALGQWSFVKAFPNANFKLPAGVNNGIAVDPDGNVWIQSYSAAADSIQRIGGTTKRACGVIRVFRPNGTELSFSPIKVVNGPGFSDTLGIGYGMRTDPNGNILSVKPSNILHRINYKTGAGMNRAVNPIPGYTSSIASVAANAAGEIFLAPVLPGGTIILDANFAALGTYADAITDFGRDILVSPDGNDVYVPRFGIKKLYIYHSDFGSLGPYAKKDSIVTGFVVETMQFNPRTGHLWVGSGNCTSGFPPPPYLPYRWYAYNMTTKQIVDSIVWHGYELFSTCPTGPDTTSRPRGIAFSPGGDTAYVAQFNNSIDPAVQMFVSGAGPVSVQREEGLIPSGFTLSQNYPNPFNPSTQIKFTLPEAGMTSLKVYDMLGREVATLVEESLAAGGYTATFDASKLSSGVYAYVLTSRGYRLSNKMVLVK